MMAVFDLVLPLFGLIFLGFLSGKLARIPFEGLAWMNFYVIYIALPALFFQLLSKTPVEQFSNIGFIGISVLTTFLMFLLVYRLAKWRNRGNVPEATIQGLAAAYGNIGYLGPPLAIAAFGPGAAVPIALIFCFENVMHFTLAPMLMALGGEEKKSGFDLSREILIKILSHPFILATIAGTAAAFATFEPPIMAERFIALLAQTAGPCALFTMGVTAALRPLKRVPSELAYIVPIKLLLHPICAYVLIVWLIPGLNPVWLYSAVLLASLPTATNVFVIAQQYGVWQERASSAVVISTLISMISVTAFLYMVQAGWLAG